MPQGLKTRRSLYDLTKRKVLGQKVLNTGPDEDIWLRDTPPGANTQFNDDPFYPGDSSGTIVDEDGNVIADDHMAQLLEGDVYSSRIGAPSPAQSHLRKGATPAKDYDLEGIQQWPNNPLTWMNQGTAFAPNESYKDNKPEPGAKF